MKRAMKHKGRLAKRSLVLVLTLTVMLMLLVPPVWAPVDVDPPDFYDGGKGGSFWIYRMFGTNNVNETQDEMLAGITDLPGNSGKPIQSEVYKLYEAQKMEGADGVLISPTGTGDKPGDSGGGKGKYNGFWVYRLFGANDVMDAREKCWWRVAVPNVKA